MRQVCFGPGPVDFRIPGQRLDNSKKLQNVLLVSGTRPEIIKLAPLYHALKATDWACVKWLHTGQHDEMASQILGCFDIAPDIALKRAGSSLLEFSIGCRQQLDDVMSLQEWSLLIVQGDTSRPPTRQLQGLPHLSFRRAALPG